MEDKQKDGKSMLIMLTLQNTTETTIMDTLSVQETTIGGDGVMETVDQEEVVWVQLKQD